MNRIQIEKSINRAVNAAPQLSFDELANLPYVKMAEHDFITKQEEIKFPAHIKQIAFATACCFLVMIFVSGWFVQNRVSDSTITMDVNPSIEIVTNKKDKVISLIALNEDARDITRGIDYKDAKLKDTVNALISSLISNGYLASDKRSILLSIKNKDSKKADAILSSLDETIKESLVSQNITPAILKQVIPKEKENTVLAKKYHISEGKMKLIQGILSSLDQYTLDMLTPMSIEALVELAEENSIDLRNLLGYGVETDDDENNGNEDQPYEEDNAHYEEDSDEDKDESESDAEEKGEDSHQSENSSIENNDDQDEDDDQDSGNDDDGDKNNSNEYDEETLNQNNQEDNKEEPSSNVRNESNEDNNEDSNSNTDTDNNEDSNSNTDTDNSEDGDNNEDSMYDSGENTESNNDGDNDIFVDYNSEDEDNNDYIDTRNQSEEDRNDNNDDNLTGDNEDDDGNVSGNEDN